MGRRRKAEGREGARLRSCAPVRGLVDELFGLTQGKGQVGSDYFPCGLVGTVAQALPDGNHNAMEGARSRHCNLQVPSYSCASMLPSTTSGSPTGGACEQTALMPGLGGRRTGWSYYQYGLEYLEERALLLGTGFPASGTPDCLLVYLHVPKPLRNVTHLQDLHRALSLAFAPALLQGQPHSEWCCRYTFPIRLSNKNQLRAGGCREYGVLPARG